MLRHYEVVAWFAVSTCGGAEVDGAQSLNMQHTMKIYLFHVPSRYSGERGGTIRAKACTDLLDCSAQCCCTKTAAMLTESQTDIQERSSDVGA